MVSTEKEQIINRAVNKLKRFGFTNVNPDNIIKDDVYRHYLEKMLKEELNIGTHPDSIIMELLNELERTGREKD